MINTLNIFLYLGSFLLGAIFGVTLLYIFYSIDFKDPYLEKLKKTNLEIEKELDGILETIRVL